MNGNATVTADPKTDTIDELVDSVLRSKSYRNLSRDAVRRIAAREIGAGKRLRETEKAVKAALRQASTAYWAQPPSYEVWLSELALARLEGADAFVAACRRIMAAHYSCRERLDYYEQLYAEVESRIGPLRRVLDLACGLNPLAIPAMHLAAGAHYYACDMDGGLVRFLNGFFAISGIDGTAEVVDLLTERRLLRAHRDQAHCGGKGSLALAMKLLPILDLERKGAGAALMRELEVEHALVTFPTRSLGGRNCGMAASYAERFRAMCEQEGWEAERLDFSQELCFLVEMGKGG